MAEPEMRAYEPDESEEPVEAQGTPTVPLAVWAAVIAALLLAIAFLDVATVSYRYNAFTQRTSRLVDDRGLVDIWREQLGDLPGGGFLEIVVSVSLAILLAGVAWGAWMLMVRAHAPGAMPERRDRRGDR